MFGLVRDMETLLVADRDVKKLSLFQRMEWAKQSAEGIAWLHGAGLLHRDIKPTNLLYHAASQSVKIADFGLAGALSVILVFCFCSFWNFWEVVFRDFDCALPCPSLFNPTALLGKGEQLEDGRTVGNPRYWAPEVIERKPYTKATDVCKIVLTFLCGRNCRECSF